MQPLLITILAVATLSLIVMGARQWRRQVRLVRAAHDIGLKFSAEDIFDVKQRYAGFELMQSGHSACADNVIFGRMRDWSLRAFDYSFEAGHGPRRLIRRFSVIAADAHLPLPDCLIWRGEDSCPASLPAAAAVTIAGQWQATGDLAAAGQLARHWSGSDGQAIGIQAQEGRLLFSTPGQLDGQAMAGRLRAVADCLEKLSLENPRVGIPRNPPTDH